jgi:hypothetical protein
MRELGQTRFGLTLVFLACFVGGCSSGSTGDSGTKPGTAGSSAGSSAGPSQLKWRCSANPTTKGYYCECRLATDAELEAAHLPVEAFTEASCPEVNNYKCCESYPKADAYDHIDTCICWNPETVPFCDGKAPIVNKCP